MKAAFYEGNKTFTVRETEVKPVGAEEVRINVAYCGICGSDVHIYHGNMDQRVNIPQVVGHEMSGVVDAVGESVTDFKPGDKIVVRPLDNRLEDESDKGFGHIAKKLKFVGIDSEGALQQSWNVRAEWCHKLPEDIDLKKAALIEPLAVACHDVRRSGLKAGEFAVVLGGGPIGMLVAMVAKATGARVVISELNPTRIALAKELGIECVSPAEVDLVEYVERESNGAFADVVFEVAGVQPTVDIMTEIAGLRGRIVMVAIHAQPKPVNLFKFFWKELSLIGARVYEYEDYETAIEIASNDEMPIERLITAAKPIDEIQDLFEMIDNNPSGMKFMIEL